MSVANYDPDFDLAEGAHQVALTLIILIRMSEASHDPDREKKVLLV